MSLFKPASLQRSVKLPCKRASQLVPSRFIVTVTLSEALKIMTRDRVDGLLTLVEWFTFGQRELLAKLAIECHIPTFFEVKDYVVSGGLTLTESSITSISRLLQRTSTRF